MTSNSESGVFREILIVLKDLKKKMVLASITIGFRGMGQGHTSKQQRGQPVNCLHVNVTPGVCGMLEQERRKKLRWFSQNSGMQAWQKGNGGRN